MSRLLATTLGRVMPRYRTVGAWVEVYRQILTTRQLAPKTVANRENSLRYLLADLGERTISAVGLKAPRAPVTRRRLTLEQWRAIHAYAETRLPPWVARMLVLALLTGQRRSDLRRMRFADVWDDHLHVEQAKTGTRLALPLALRLEAIGVSLGQAIEACRDYARPGATLLRRTGGAMLTGSSLSARFEEAREAACGAAPGYGAPSLHECRSLSERLFRAQGIDTRILLGHKHQAMTDVYNDDRGLLAASWQVLPLPQ